MSVPSTRPSSALTASVSLAESVQSNQAVFDRINQRYANDIAREHALDQLMDEVTGHGARLEADDQSENEKTSYRDDDDILVEMERLLHDVTISQKTAQSTVNQLHQSRFARPQTATTPKQDLMSFLSFGSSPTKKQPVRVSSATFRPQTSRREKTSSVGSSMIIPNRTVHTQIGLDERIRELNITHRKREQEMEKRFQIELHRLEEENTRLRIEAQVKQENATTAQSEVTDLNRIIALLKEKISIQNGQLIKYEREMGRLQDEEDMKLKLSDMNLDVERVSAEEYLHMKRREEAMGLQLIEAQNRISELEEKLAQPLQQNLNMTNYSSRSMESELEAPTRMSQLQQKVTVAETKVAILEKELERQKRRTNEWGNVELELCFLFERVSGRKLKDYYDFKAEAGLGMDFLEDDADELDPTKPKQKKTTSAHSTSRTAQPSSSPPAKGAKESNAAGYVVPNPDNLMELINALSLYVEGRVETAAGKRLIELTGLANKYWVKYFHDEEELKFRPKMVFDRLVQMMEDEKKLAGGRERVIQVQKENIKMVKDENEKLKREVRRMEIELERTRKWVREGKKEEKNSTPDPENGVEFTYIPDTSPNVPFFITEAEDEDKEETKSRSFSRPQSALNTTHTTSRSNGSTATRTRPQSAATAQSTLQWIEWEKKYEKEGETLKQREKQIKQLIDDREKERQRQEQSLRLGMTASLVLNQLEEDKLAEQRVKSRKMKRTADGKEADWFLKRKKENKSIRTGMDNLLSHLKK
ncbi:hypothetical protein BLNAU_911 [Blattamonas nauphoetae]|uniref:Uncharacterized protein n=1 Tax=Blattamonas nauphoetae TaxID=2049346 RepID=A0ABQ9YKU9_9EUKA|nr:hypothetical protein BLNAU_911 [Blattamonas nauphoetae]